MRLPELARNTLVATFSCLAACHSTQSSPLPRAGAVADADRSASSESPIELEELVSPLVPGSPVSAGGYRLANPAIGPADPSIVAKVGGRALWFSGRAEGAGSKGDFGLYSTLHHFERLALWVYLPKEANVENVGFQLTDARGQVSLSLVPATFVGWQRLELVPGKTAIKPAYEQANYDGKLEFPLASVHLAWFTRAAGKTELGVNALTRTVKTEAPTAPHVLRLSLLPQAEASLADRGRSLALLTNLSEAPLDVELTHTILRDSALSSPPAPDPVFGTDHARGQKSATFIKGREQQDNSLTDDDLTTFVELPWDGAGHDPVEQVVDLGRVRTITLLRYRNSDANWIWKVDVFASSDGKRYQNVAGLSAIDLHKRWGLQSLAPAAPFSARYLRLRYYDKPKMGESVRLPRSLEVYDGPVDEPMEPAPVGPVVGRSAAHATVPARSFAVVELEPKPALGQGAYLVGALARSGEARAFTTRELYVAAGPSDGSAASGTSTDAPRSERLGINTSELRYAALNRAASAGWVRFENLKWPFVSPARGVFRFDGSVGPWHVNVDNKLETYARLGLDVLPYLFLTPDYAAPEGERREHRPPLDSKDYGEFCFQVAARYGKKRHPEAALKTDDRKSGLGLLQVYELWNEPNLNQPSWGHFLGTLDEYYALLREGAKGIKRADPSARVANGGFAGIDLAVVDTIARHEYPDGKRALDVIDVLSVHYYSGRVAPELATVNTNEDRSGTGDSGLRFQENLRALVAWRDQNRPGLPIWMTETGFDTGGPNAVSEREQAAFTPRNILLQLGEGIEKVLVYREKGSADGLYAASGLIRDDHTLKPSYFTYRTLARLLSSASSIEELTHTDENVRLYAVRAPTGVTLAAWSVRPTAKPVLGLDLGMVTVTDAFGGSLGRLPSRDLGLSDFVVYLSEFENQKALAALLEREQALRSARRDRERREAKLEVRLFDFGSKKLDGWLFLGRLRYFTPVVASDRWSEQKGHGFVTGPGADEDRHWIGNPLTRDRVRFEPGHEFRFRTKPGRHAVTIGAEQRGPAPKLTLRSGSFTHSLELPHGARTATVELDLPPDVASQGLTLSTDETIALEWLSVVEVVR